MRRHIDKEAANDRAKLMIHRLVARRIAHDPRLLDTARAIVTRFAADHPGSSFPGEWSVILDLPPQAIRRKLTSRDDDMQRLRLSSPFAGTPEMAFLESLDLRRRIWRLACKAAAERGKALSA